MVDTLTAQEISGITEPMNLFDILWHQVVARPHKEALVFEHERLTYSNLMSRVCAISAQLRGMGVKRNDRVAILFPNHPDYVASFFAATSLGATVVPINPLLRSEEIAHIISDSGAETLIVHQSGLQEALKSQQPLQSLKTILVSGRFDQDSVLPSLNVEELTTARASLSQLNFEKSIDGNKDLALLVYTSGTTGKPKGAMLTHSNILAVFPKRLSMLDIGERDRTLAVLPMCHIYGITVVMIGTLSTGGTLAMLPKFDPVAALSLIAGERITIVPAVPAMHRFMVMELERGTYDVSSVRLCLSGGSALPLDLMREIETRMGAACLEGYALTETACAATLNPLHGKRKVGSVGPAMEGLAVRVIDANGTALASGEANVGEIQVRGANVMLGYYKLEEASREVIDSNGWFSTGDLGYLDAEGYLFIVGRKKEMIIRGGQNIYPREIEDILARMPGVVEAAVIGVPDKFMGERVKAIVVAKTSGTLTEEAVKEFCAEHLAEYKVPRIVEFRDTLPRNSTGKVLKRML
jgi:long-chain acyl-CoA synthetase